MVAVLACSQTCGGRVARAIASPTTRVDAIRDLQDFPTIRRAIPAVDAAPRKVGDHVRAVDLALPRTRSGTIPADHPPRPAPWLSAEHDDIVPVTVEGSRQRSFRPVRSPLESRFSRPPLCQPMNRLLNSGLGMRQRS